MRMLADDSNTVTFLDASSPRAQFGLCSVLLRMQCVLCVLIAFV